MSMLRVLAFEDSYDIRALLGSGGVEMGRIELVQYWDTSDALERIVEFEPDILLLDHYISPATGLEVLQSLNTSVARNGVKRPANIIGISSSSSANIQFKRFGADLGVSKFNVAQLDIWTD